MGSRKQQGRGRSLPEQSRGRDQERGMEKTRYNCEIKEERMRGGKGEAPQIQDRKARVHRRPTLAPSASGRGEPGGCEN